MDPITVYITGTAGVGKTTFTAAFKGWMQEAGYSVATVNLDPGMEGASFEPDVDVRDWVKLDEVMATNHLGPNGAQIAASDMVAVDISDIRAAIEPVKTDYVLVDTPGQVELFAFREASKAIVEELSGERSIIAFLFDPMLARTPGGLVSLFMLSATVQFRFSLPMMNILAKDDLLNAEERETLRNWLADTGKLYEALGEGARGGEGIVSQEFFKSLETIGPLWSLLFTSAHEGRGMADFYSEVQRIFTGGEDLDRDAGTSGEPL